MNWLYIIIVGAIAGWLAGKVMRGAGFGLLGNIIIGILGGYAFSVFVQDVNPGAFAAGITLLTGVPEVIISCVKAALFGLIAGLVACYRGLMITGGGAKAVGNAVNETVVYAFMALFVVNVVVTAIGIRMTTG